MILCPWGQDRKNFTNLGLDQDHQQIEISDRTGPRPDKIWNFGLDQVEQIFQSRSVDSRG